MYPFRHPFPPDSVRRIILDSLGEKTTNVDDEDDERDRVQLLTIHAAKGLEWPFVFVVGMEEGTLPHERSIGDPAALEEERRLCYVALTRAGERLYLSWTASRNRGSG